jgi:hypothetical protein
VGACPLFILSYGSPEFRVVNGIIAENAENAESAGATQMNSARSALAKTRNRQDANVAHESLRRNLIKYPWFTAKAFVRDVRVFDVFASLRGLEYHKSLERRLVVVDVTRAP